MIGINILGYPTDFLAAFDKGHDIAVHTWTHPYMTTLSNEELVAEVCYSFGNILHWSDFRSLAGLHFLFTTRLEEKYLNIGGLLMVIVTIESELSPKRLVDGTNGACLSFLTLI
jgi:hypothetical protein